MIISGRQSDGIVYYSRELDFDFDFDFDSEFEFEFEFQRIMITY